MFKKGDILIHNKAGEVQVIKYEKTFYETLVLVRCTTGFVGYAKECDLTRKQVSGQQLLFKFMERE